MSFPIPDCPDTYRDKQRHTQTHRPKDTHTHTHTHTHTQIHTLESVLVYSFILGTLYIQICLSKKKKKTMPYFIIHFSCLHQLYQRLMIYVIQ